MLFPVRNVVRAFGCLVAVLALVAVVRPSAAVPRENQGNPVGRDPSTATGPAIPNVPDRQGCVEECEFDLNPCDTPLEKKLDGRCTLRD